MLKRVATALLGKFESREEVQKFLLLGLIFGLMIGIYWALRPIKDGIFSVIVGFDYQPVAKWLSLFLIVPVIFIYGKLADMFSREKVFYIFVGLYTILWLIFAWLFSSPVYGLANTVSSPTRMLGWLWYISIESWGTIMVPLFWAITADITTEDSAKRGFPLIALMAQTGNILGPLFLNARRLGFSSSAPIVLILGAMTLCMGLIMFVFMKVTPRSQLKGYQEEVKVHEKEKEPGFLEGLRLLLTQPYLLGIFAIATAYEIIVTIVDFYFKLNVKMIYPLEVDFSAYMANFAATTGVVATLCVLFGISNIQRRLGITASLVMTPLLLACGVILLKINPTLAVAFWIMVIFKAVNYALNQPTIKQLYIPTSKDAKYKSQAWIEVFGGRGAKAGGSAVNAFNLIFRGKYGVAAGTSLFLTMSTSVSLGLVIGWLFIVVFVAKKYNRAI
ncbi:MAG: Npt1/Npt2 family nucleotide transporter, partial [bacterium]|nr:Npt1/Npt2 family nucleotide transporter [bacterium]